MNQRMIKNCLPCMIALTLTGVYSIIDGIFIGHCVGDDGLAAINIAWPIPALITATGFGIGTGCCIFYASSIGKKEYARAKSGILMAYLEFIVVSVLMTALLYIFYPDILALLGAKGRVYDLAKEYAQVIIAGTFFQIFGAGCVPILRSQGKMFVAMLVMLVGMVVNLCLNSVLLFVFHLGMQGVAIGTITAQAVVGILCIVIIWKDRKKESIGSEGQRKTARIDVLSIGIRILQLGISSFGISLSSTIVLIFTNFACLKYGGSMAVAVYASISYIVFPIQALLQGIGEGVLPMLSFAYGQGNTEESQEIQSRAKKAVGILGMSLFILVWLSAHTLSGVFGLSAGGQKIFIEGMQISSIAFILLGFVKCNLSCLNGMQEIKKAVILTYTESVVITPIVLAILPKLLGLQGIWFSLTVVAGIMIVFYQIMNKKRKW